MKAPPTISAIPTKYAGVTFRSRLEARWAVFMDLVEVKWQYEPEGYDISGVWYLPDFWLPGMDSFLEIKPDRPSSEDEAKASGLRDISGKAVYLLFGSPHLPGEIGDESESAFYYPPDGGEDYCYYWCHCPHCNRTEIQFSGRADRISCSCPKSAHGDKGYNYDTPRMVFAYDEARRFRFTA